MRNPFPNRSSFFFRFQRSGLRGRLLAAIDDILKTLVNFRQKLTKMLLEEAGDEVAAMTDEIC
jgi:hypothetical protein